METNLIFAQILKTNENIQALEAQLQSRVTQVIEMNRQITEINDEINFSYRHLKALKTLEATQNTSTQFQFGSNSMTNDDGLNAESDLLPNQDNKELWSNYERHYGRLHYNADFRAERRGQVKSHQHQAPIIPNQTKLDNYFTLVLNIVPKYNLNSVILNTAKRTRFWSFIRPKRVTFIEEISNSHRKRSLFFKRVKNVTIEPF